MADKTLKFYDTVAGTNFMLKFVDNGDGTYSLGTSGAGGGSGGLASASSATLTSVAGATGSTQLVAANSGRKGLTVYNDSTATLYIAFATSASTSAYTVQVGAGGYWEMPGNSIYTGAVFGVWSAASGNARITEF